jgi:hypothetical protein
VVRRTNAPLRTTDNVRAPKIQTQRGANGYRGRRLNDMAVLQRRVRITTKYVKGQTQLQIAEAEGISLAQVSRDLLWIRNEWLKRALANRDELAAKELAHLDHAETEAWEGWERSKQPVEETQTEKAQFGIEDQSSRNRVRSRARVKKRQRDGNPAFLQIVLSVVDRRCKLLGLDAPQEVDLESDIRLWARRNGLDEDEAVAEARKHIREMKSEAVDWNEQPALPARSP